MKLTKSKLRKIIKEAIELESLRNNIRKMVRELDFKSKEAYKKYQSQHKVKPGTRVNIGGEINLIIKEMQVGLLLGILYGILLGVFAKITFPNAHNYLGVVVGLSICVSMIVAATVGTIIPLILRKLDIDPAVATGPFVTTSIDILGVLFYFLIAGLFLSI